MTTNNTHQNTFHTSQRITILTSSLKLDKYNISLLIFEHREIILGFDFL